MNWDDLQIFLDDFLNFEKTPKKNIFWLKTMKILCEKAKNPENLKKIFHIAGSKGKGSISEMIFSILREAEISCGIFTSPHILHFKERIRFFPNEFEAHIFEKSFCELKEILKTANFPVERKPTWFELVTLFAFLVFRAANVDSTVLEVGLGGRLDATNVVFPSVCCISMLEKEHTEFLGKTLKKIAQEKGGIIKQKTPVICAPQKFCAKRVLKKITKDKNAKIIFVKNERRKSRNALKLYTKVDTFSVKQHIIFDSKFFSRPICCDLNLLGDFQIVNAKIAAIAVKTVFPQITENQIEKGLSKTFLPCRFEIISQNPLIILDGAHTKKSIQFSLLTLKNLLKKINHEFGKSKKIALPHLLFACAKDKDSKKIARLFKNRFSCVLLTTPGEKLCDLEKNKRELKKSHIKFSVEENPECAVKIAFKNATKCSAPLLIIGSFYLTAIAKKVFKEINSKS